MSTNASSATTYLVNRVLPSLELRRGRTAPGARVDVSFLQRTPDVRIAL